MDLVGHKKYRDRIWSALHHCDFLGDPNFHFSFGVHPSEEHWTKAQLEIEVRFSDSSRLKVQEIFSTDDGPIWRKDKRVLKKICYQYMGSANALIFRLDSHHLPIEMSGSLHLDLPGMRHIYDGNQILRGTSIASSDFFTAYEWIRRRMIGETLPWEEPDAKS
jgi:hypothetical protein